ncbi:hypothetical protein cyc_06339 [Cyclospora cayetanensis]|uniref:Uncharacterized protein n=1 Tax=Cyclospora cayetanensis TaxID=88456 RepID=A0A1D3CUD3_9EIME|nr:hypothetical protein cyc_06339 [Cyclospora cayetanensis]
MAAWGEEGLFEGTPAVKAGGEEDSYLVVCGLKAAHTAQDDQAHAVLVHSASAAACAPVSNTRSDTAVHRVPLPPPRRSAGLHPTAPSAAQQLVLGSSAARHLNHRKSAYDVALEALRRSSVALRCSPSRRIPWSATVTSTSMLHSPRQRRSHVQLHSAEVAADAVSGTLTSYCSLNRSSAACSLPPTSPVSLPGAARGEKFHTREAFSSSEDDASSALAKAALAAEERTPLSPRRQRGFQPARRGPLELSPSRPLPSVSALATSSPGANSAFAAARTNGACNTPDGGMHVIPSRSSRPLTATAAPHKAEAPEREGKASAFTEQRSRLRHPSFSSIRKSALGSVASLAQQISTNAPVLLQNGKQAAAAAAKRAVAVASAVAAVAAAVSADTPSGDPCAVARHTARPCSRSSSVSSARSASSNQNPSAASKSMCFSGRSSRISSLACSKTDDSETVTTPCRSSISCISSLQPPPLAAERQLHFVEVAAHGASRPVFSSAREACAPAEFESSACSESDELSLKLPPSPRTLRGSEGSKENRSTTEESKRHIRGPESRCPPFAAISEPNNVEGE